MSDLPVKFDASGLIPVVIQDDSSNQVLMVAFMNAEALHRTRETGEVHFWSRSRERLWRKGETSGHIQRVRTLFVNCNEDSLLVRVEQVGACCHTGHATCYYRQIDESGALTTVGDRLFDPDSVYGTSPLTEAIRTWIGAYGWLAANDLSDISGTSKLLRSSTPAYLASRVADELGEVAGVLNGTHRHEDPNQDLLLEGSQVLYWLALTALRSGADPAELAAQIGHAQANIPENGLVDLATSIEAASSSWNAFAEVSLFALIEETVRLLARAAELMQTTFGEIVRRDLAELRARSYLEPYFAMSAP